MNRSFFVVAVALCKSSVCFAAESANAIPTHCKQGEFAYLNAKMSEVHYPQYKTEEERKTKPVWILKSTGKILSICMDRAAEPFNSVAYRFGPVGRVELDKVANQAAPFNVFDRFEGPSGHVGDHMLFFAAGPYTYCVSEAFDNGSGVTLTVLKRGQEIVYLFSGNDRGRDYESGLIHLSFSQPQSPALKLYDPDETFGSPCDGKRLIRP